MLEETNKDLANIINKRAEESENKRRIKALEEEENMEIILKLLI